MRSEAIAEQDLNAVRLQNAVLCVDCEVVSNSPHERCLVCGSKSLFSLSRVLGGTLSSQRAVVVETDPMVSSLPRVVLPFPSQHREFCRTVSHRKARRA
jgi:hypothetical protein